MGKPRPRVGRRVVVLLAAVAVIVLAGAVEEGVDDVPLTSTTAPEPAATSVVPAVEPTTPRRSTSAVPSPTPSVGRGPARGMPAAAPATAQRGVVERVVDGDTIWVRIDDRGGPLVPAATHKVRLLLVDTPETVHPDQPVACYGREASRYVHDRLLGETVWLEADEQDTDRYGRFLRHVWLGDGTNVNLELVERGYADAVRYEPNGKYWPAFSAAADTARSRRTGLWGACEAFGAARDADEADREARESTDRGPAGGPSCDPSYPTVCIPPAPPDLDCGQIAPRRFEVTGADPHGFDGNHDGVGCEGG